MRVVLLGPPGVGKTATGRALADLLHLPFVDTDERVAQKAGVPSAAEALRRLGEEAFRQMEAEVVAALPPDEVVVATGGGTLLAFGAWEALATPVTRMVALEAPVEALVKRVGRRPDSRPLLQGEEGTEAALRRLLAQRRPLYARAEMRVRSTHSPQETAAQVAAYLAAASAPGEPVDDGALRYLPGLVPGPCYLVVDEGVEALYGGRVERLLGRRLRGRVRLPAGEAAKRMSVVVGAARQLVRLGADRHSCLVALGGGSLGDAAGLLASLYMRGIPWVAVPTTLLAMVDASLGGKVAVDLPEGKNLLGAFHPPARTVVDPSLLATLPPHAWREGLAEMVKAAILGDGRLLDRLTQGPLPPAGEELTEAIRAARRVKAQVVAEDPREGQEGGRERLNLGHTLGHALEAATQYRVSHGTAVSIGLWAILRLAQEMGLLPAHEAEPMEKALRAQGLPASFMEAGYEGPLPTARSVLASMRRDKKARDGKVRLVLPVAVGRVVVRPAQGEELERLVELAGLGRPSSETPKVGGERPRVLDTPQGR